MGAPAYQNLNEWYQAVDFIGQVLTFCNGALAQKRRSLP